MTHAIHFLSTALKDAPTSICDSQLAAIEAVQKIFANWRTVKSLPPESPKVLPQPTPVVPLQALAPATVPSTHFKVWPRQREGNHFQGYIPTTATHKF